MKRLLFPACLIIFVLWWGVGSALSQENVKAQCSLPLLGLRLTSGFGYRIHPITRKRDLHKGIDLSARCDPVLSILNGYVIEIGFNPILGKHVRISHGEFQSIYGHLSQILISKGDTVNAGQVIAITGSTGRTTGEHLHFSMRFKGKYINPLHFLSSLLLPNQ